MLNSESLHNSPQPLLAVQWTDTHTYTPSTPAGQQSYPQDRGREVVCSKCHACKQLVEFGNTWHGSVSRSLRVLFSSGELENSLAGVHCQSNEY